ncbi:F-box/LRR-repeat protein 18-like [Glandiceps talaboti]
MEQSLECFSDEILLMIFSFLEPIDTLTLRGVNKRFQKLASDPTLGRIVSDSYRLTSQQLKIFFKYHSKSINSFNIHQSYWFKSEVLTSGLPKCTELVEVDLCGSNITPKTLSNILSHTPKLTTLGWLDRCHSSTEAMTFHKHFDERSKNTLQQLRKLELVFGRMEHLSLLPFCQDLRILKLDALYSATYQYVMYQNTSGFQENNRTATFCTKQSLSVVYLQEIYLSEYYFNVCVNALCFRKLCEVDRNERLEAPLHVLVASSSSFRAEIVERFAPYFSTVHTLGISFKPRTVSYDENIASGVLSSKKFLHFCKGDQLNKDDLYNIAVSSPELEGLGMMECKHVLKSPQRTYDGSGLMAISENCEGLKQLNICTCFDDTIHTVEESKNLAGIIASMKGLTSLSLPSCLFVYEAQGMSQSSSVQATAVPFGFKRKRVGIQNTSLAPGDEDNGLLADIVNECIKMEEFELIDPTFRSLIFPASHIDTCQFRASENIRDLDLMSISRWKKLRKLTLVGLPNIVYGNSLVTIAMQCKQLTSLSLAFIGRGLHVLSVSLSQALPHCFNLQDLRIEQSTFNMTRVFWTALSKCSKLQRLCIITRHDSLQKEGLLELFEACQQLVVCYIFCKVPIAFNTSLVKAIRNKYKAQRPALSVVIQQLPLEFREIPIPQIHFEELVMFRSHVMTSLLTPLIKL